MVDTLNLQEEMDPCGMSEHRKNETKQNIVPELAILCLEVHWAICCLPRVTG